MCFESYSVSPSIIGCPIYTDVILMSFVGFAVICAAAVAGRFELVVTL
jgi:hypothetical protein